MQIKIIFDNSAIDTNYSTGLGFSCLINDEILFDTGPEPKALFNNFNLLNMNANQISKVVISHNHWDHTGGLWELLKQNQNLLVYSCPDFSPDFYDKVANLNTKLIKADSLLEIIPSVFTTGQIPGLYKGQPMPEQAMVIKTEKGISVITGCAHPGIIQIIAKVKHYFPNEPIYAVLGGFHLKDKTEEEILLIINQFKEFEIKKMGPTHCSGDLAIRLFKKEYKNNFIDVMVGGKINV